MSDPDLVLIEPSRGSVHTPSGDLGVREIVLGGTPRGLVIVLPDATIAEVEVVETMNSLAAEGYETIAACASPGQFDAIAQRASERDWAGDQIGVVGLGAGGSLALRVARERGFGAAVSFAPDLDVSDVLRLPVLRTPWLGMFGADTEGLDRAAVEAVRNALRDGSDVFSQVVVYPGVGRYFHRRSASGVGFAASYDGWQRAVEWLNARVAARLTPLAVAWRQRSTGLTPAPPQ